MIKLIYHTEDSTIAPKVEADLRAAKYQLREGNPQKGDIAVVVYSKKTWDSLKDEVTQIIDQGLHLVPVSVDGGTPPHLIDHLPIIYYNTGYDFALLDSEIKRVKALGENSAHMRVLTPRVRLSNTRLGILISGIAVLMFIAGVILIKDYNIEFPTEEYNSIETFVALTRDVIVEPIMATYAQYLPDRPGVDFEPTLDAIPTVYRPLVRLTATAHAQSLIQLTPMPTGTSNGS